MNFYLYSPLPIESYYITALPFDTLRTVRTMEEHEAIWNLMWLSFPQLDTLPGAGANWYKGYTAKPGLFPACAQDVNEYETLAEMLKCHPAEFAKWFAKEDHKVWHCYAIGSDEWVSTVLARAEEAATRISGNIKSEGNVIHVQFGGK